MFKQTSDLVEIMKRNSLGVGLGAETICLFCGSSVIPIAAGAGPGTRCRRRSCTTRRTPSCTASRACGRTRSSCRTGRLSSRNPRSDDPPCGAGRSCGTVQRGALIICGCVSRDASRRSSSLARQGVSSGWSVAACGRPLKAPRWGVAPAECG